MNHFDLVGMFSLGLFGVGHCVGMCGPLVLAFPTPTGKFTAHLFYHLGRITTYAAIGAIMGALGAGLKSVASGAEHLVWMARIQVGFSLFAALFLLLFGLVRLKILSEPAWMSVATPMRIPGFSRTLRSAVSGSGAHGMFTIGLMLGLLPCGLSYAAFARALPSGDAVQGGLLLLAFGLGTLPGLMLIGTGASKLAVRYRTHSEILSGLLMIGMALALFASVNRGVGE